MFKRSLILLVIATFAISGLADAQLPVTSSTPKPDYFKGMGGVHSVANSAQFVESGTILEGKDTFVTFKIEHNRTGVLKNDVTFKAGGGQIFDAASTIPAGTLMYAMNYGAAYDRTSYRSVGGLAWCAVRDDKDKPICIFWDGTRRTILFKKEGKPIKNAAYVDGHSGQSKYYAPGFQINVVEGGTIPVIEEGPVDFGREFTVKLRFDKFKKDTLRISGRFHDGDKEVNYLGPLMRFNKVKLNEKGETIFSMFGKNIKFTKLGKKEARFEVIEP